jgi:hypothetical protein
MVFCYIYSKGDFEWAIKINSLNLDDENQEIYAVVDSGASDIVLSE